MLALECKCAWADLAKVRAEIGAVLPNTQVIELSGKALARAEARAAAAENAAAAIEREKAARQEMRRQRGDFIAMAVPIVGLLCVAFIAALFLLNAKERLPEVGLFRSLGMSAPRVLTIFLGKALLLGGLGGTVGALLGCALAAWTVNKPTMVGVGAILPNASTCVWIVIGAALASLLASWLPALRAAYRDPADILRED